MKNEFYKVRRDMHGQWQVVRVDTNRPVFYGTKAECEGWFERNGHEPQDY